jgi:hypothetical protein
MTACRRPIMHRHRVHRESNSLHHRLSPFARCIAHRRCMKYRHPPSQKHRAKVCKNRAIKSLQKPPTSPIFRLMKKEKSVKSAPKKSTAPATPSTKTTENPKLPTTDDVSRYIRLQVYSTLGAIGIFLLGVATYTGSLRLFPNAQEYMERHGYDPRLVAQVTDTKDALHIRDTLTNSGFIHSLMDPFVAFKLPDSKATYVIQRRLLSLFRTQVVSFPETNATLRDLLIRLTRLSPQTVERDPISSAINKLACLLHELRHSSEANRALETILEKEEDADRIMLLILKNPELQTAWIHFRAINFVATHDNALILTRRFNGKKIPSREESTRATTEMRGAASALIESDPVLFIRKPWAINLPDGKTYSDSMLGAYYEKLCLLLAKNPGRLSPDARERADLFRKGMEYYTPTLTNNIRGYIAETQPGVRLPDMTP